MKSKKRTVATAADMNCDGPVLVEEESIGARIRERRKKIRIKQAMLAQEAGISASQLCHIEKSGVRPSIRTLGKIAEALGITVGALLGGAETPARFPEAAAPISGDALASDALANGQGSWQDVQRLMTVRPEKLPSRLRAFRSALIEPVTGLWRVHDARDMAVDRRVRARLTREIAKRKALERDAGVSARCTLPLEFPAAAEHGVMLSRVVRNAAGIGPAAVVDWQSLLEINGLRILETKLPSGMDGWSLWDPIDGTAFVFLRAAATTERRRFRLAYELGHLARFLSGGMRPLRDIGASKKISIAFAAALLMPEEAVRMATFPLGLGPGKWTWELLLLGKERFGVSAETFLYRIDELGLLSMTERRTLRERIRNHYAACRAAQSRDIEPRPAVRAGLRAAELLAKTAQRKLGGSRLR